MCATKVSILVAVDFLQVIMSFPSCLPHVVGYVVLCYYCLGKLQWLRCNICNNNNSKTTTAMDESLLRIIREEGYRQVLVVTSPDLRHACVPWFQGLQERTGLQVSVNIQAKSLLEDFCALVRAPNLVAAAVVSRRLRRLYVREFADNSLLNCRVWPGVLLQQYELPIGENSHAPYDNSYAGVMSWFQTYNASLISRREVCKER
ncbi:unnamed protein product [Polarella glacialis]|uniref:Uncharacterized protein n=1 Tax=Polarella glacialis TaxID=89957 RepID=A0A813FUL2_POLGL|nr:unnamed protein product [Polarella glacialis]